MRADDSWEAEEAVDLRHYWNVFRREKWLILGCAVAVTLVTASVVRTLTPVYAASATLLIESEQPNVISIEGVYARDARTQQYYDTQFEILRSRPIAESVIESLGLAEVSKRLNGAGRGGFDWHEWLAPIAKAAGMDGPPADPKRAAIERYYSSLSIEPIADTQLVRVRFESESPELAARVANAHAQTYIETMLDARLAVTESAATWMTKRLEEMRRALNKAEAELQAFREREQLVDVDGLRALPSAEINEISSRLVAVRQTLAAAEIADNQVSNAGSGSGALQGIPAILDDPGVRAFQADYAEKQQAVAELGKRYGPKHPRMIAAEAELELARANLEEQRASVAERIRREYEAAVEEERALVAALERAREDYQSVGRKESELNALQRAVETNRELYDLFYNRVSETAVTSDLQAAQARIVESAVAAVEPVKPRSAMIIGGAFIGTFLLGLAVAFVSDGLNNTLRSAKDVEERLDVPLLAMVPQVPGKLIEATRTGVIDDAEYGEALRTLRTGILLDNVDRPHKVVLVTSAVSGEGKSTVALNLAAALAKTGRVCLVDADMRRPSIGALLGMPRYEAGLSELVSRTAPFKACLAKTHLENLHVVRTGFIPADPLQLLSRRRMAEIVRVFSKYYDHVVIDSPPILPVSDAAVLSKYADAVVFVAKSESTPVPQIQNGLNLLRRVNAPVTGVVVNSLDTRKARKYSDFGYGGYYEPYTTTITKA